MRIVTMVLLLAVLAYCVFGFSATFEPMNTSRQWVWRIVYGGIGMVCVATFAWMVRPRK
jgi:hypothetical protein